MELPGGRNRAMQALTNAATSPYTAAAIVFTNCATETIHWSELAWRRFDPMQIHLEIQSSLQKRLCARKIGKKPKFLDRSKFFFRYASVTNSMDPGGRPS